MQTIELQDIDLATLETVVGGGPFANGVGVAAGLGTAYVTAPLMPFMAAAGGAVGLGYGASKGIREGYARNGVLGAIAHGTVDALKYGAGGAFVGAVGPSVIAGSAARNIVKNLGG